MPLRSMGICACATRTDAPAGARVHPHTYSGCAIILLLCLTSEIFRKCLFRTHAPLLLFRDHPLTSFPAHLSTSACLGHDRAVSTAKVGTPTTRRGHVC